MDERPETVRDLFDNEYVAMVRLATVITGDVGVAEEIAQEAFARAIARWGRIRTYDRPGAWLRRVTIRLAMRDRARRREIDRLPDAEAEPASVTVEPTDPDLLYALSSLPRNQRTALFLFYFDGLSTEEVAVALGVRPGTARSHLHRGRTALAQLLSNTEVIADEH
jgi:RNA polymerase sigma-70 factor (ECF subfamily)